MEMHPCFKLQAHPYNDIIVRQERVKQIKRV